MINNVQDLLKRTITEADAQIKYVHCALMALPCSCQFQLAHVGHYGTVWCPVYRHNRNRKQEMEMDWSDKKEAEELDAFCANLRNEHTCKQFHAGSAKFQEM